MAGAVLWDLDGTLVDSEELHWLAWRETMAREGIPITREQFRATFGLRNDAIILKWLPEASPAGIVRVGERKEVSYRRRVAAEGVGPLPGAADWVKRLGAEGWRQAVASSGPRRNVEVSLRALGFSERIQAIASAEDVKKGKPDPQVFLTAAKRLRTEPGRCIVVEDAAAGVEAGRRAGMATIGLSRNGASLGADVNVSSLADLPRDAFERLLGPG